jgi:hypothetical protein
MKSKKLVFSGNGPFRIALDTHSAQSVIQMIQTPLTSLDIHAPSLEDAYVEIITKNHAKH